jgi:hypothetical protein
MLAFQSMLGELIQLIQIYIGKKLAGKIPDRQPFVFGLFKQCLVLWYMFKQILAFGHFTIFRAVVINNDPGKPDYILIFSVFFYQVKQDILIHSNKKRPYVHLQAKSLFIIIFCYASGKTL